MHWDVLAATDFFTVEVWHPVGLVRYHVLFVMYVATRRVHIAGIAHNPGGEWMEQMARNLTDAFDGFLLGKRYLICDRDSLFSARFARFSLRRVSRQCAFRRDRPTSIHIRSGFSSP